MKFGKKDAMKGSSVEAFRIYIPHKCFGVKNGILIGTHDLKEQIACVTGIIHNVIPEAVLETNRILAENELSFLGVWIKDGHTNIREQSFYQDACRNGLSQTTQKWFCLHSSDGYLPQCTLHGSWIRSPELIITLYDADSVNEANLLEFSNDQIPLESDVYHVHNALNYHQKLFMSKTHPFHDNHDRTDFLIPKNGRVRNITNSMFSGTSRFATLLLSLIAITLGNRWLCNKTVKTICGLPAFLNQVKKKTKELKIVPGYSKGTPKQKIIHRTVVLRHFMDICIGIVVMSWLLHGDVSHQIASQMMTWAHNVASELQNLLVWMMGVPAGLKLNRHLDQFLGNFFMYHIYLWKGYLKLLEPVLSDVIWYISLMGCLGFTVQLSLVQDVLSLMTLHIYCFYVYAARLYFLLLYALSSLWKLFRGKKRNILRDRVDSASYDVDQLIIGTLLFTIVLFLLPTVALYYVVFTGLRLLILTVQGVLSKVVFIINKLPVYGIILRLFHPNAISDGVKYTVLRKSKDRPLYLSMMTTPARISTIYAKTQLSKSEAQSGESWTQFWKDIIVGNLVYPWIDSIKVEKNS